MDGDLFLFCSQGLYRKDFGEEQIDFLLVLEIANGIDRLLCNIDVRKSLNTILKEF